MKHYILGIIIGYVLASFGFACSIYFRDGFLGTLEIIIGVGVTLLLVILLSHYGPKLGKDIQEEWVAEKRDPQISDPAPRSLFDTPAVDWDTKTKPIPIRRMKNLLRRKHEGDDPTGEW